MRACFILECHHVVRIDPYEALTRAGRTRREGR